MRYARPCRSCSMRSSAASDDGAVLLQVGLADPVAEPVVRRENPQQRPQCPIGLLRHAGHEDPQRDVRIVPEQRRNDGRAQRRAKRLVEIILQRERALLRGCVTRVQRRLREAFLERGDDPRGIGDGPAVEPQDGQLALARRAPGADQVVGAEHSTAVRDALVVERPAHFFVVVRERNVPQQRSLHGGRSSHQR